MRSDFPRSRPARLAPAISFVATRTTRSPRASRNRSKAPETCRQSSSAQTRSLPSERPQSSAAPKPLAPTSTVLSPSSSPVPAATAAIVCELLCMSAPSTIIRVVPSSDLKRTPGGHGLLEGDATLLSSHAEHPRPATSDTTEGSQALDRPTASKRVSSPPVGTFSSTSDVTDEANHNSKPQSSVPRLGARDPPRVGQAAARGTGGTAGSA